MEHRGRIFRFSDVEVREGEFSVRKDGQVLPVEPKAYKVLEFLLSNPGRVVSKNELLDAIWRDVEVSESSLTRAIAILRRLLGDDVHEQRFIATIATVGYRFVCPVEVVEGPPVAAAEPAPLPARPETPPPAPPTRLWPRWLWWAAAVVAVLAVALLVTWWRIPPAVPVVESIVQLTDDGRPKGVIATDGVRICFNEFDVRSGVTRIAQVSIIGGPTAPVETGLKDSYLIGTTWNDTALVVAAHGSEDVPGDPLWLVPLPTGEPRRIGSFETWYADNPLDNRTLDIFPDGRIAFAQFIQGKDEKGSDSRTDYFITDKDGLNARKLVSLPGFVRRVSASPSGQRVLISQEQRGDPHLFEIAKNGTGLREILGVGADERNFVWTPDEKYLIYQSGNIHSSDIWLLPMRTGLLRNPGKPIRLTNGPLPFTYPYPNPHGNQILALGTKDRGELVRYDIKSHQFQTFLSGISATDPTFSRDGKWVAYASYPDRTLWRSRNDGTDRMQLTFPPMEVRSPFISPDGTKVSFHTDKGELYVVGVNGGSPQRISENGAWASWSPDGNYLYYQLFAPGGGGGSIADVRTGKKFAVPNTEGFWAFWLTQDILAGSNQDYTNFVTFSLKTHKFSDLTNGTLGQIHIQNWMPSPDNKYLYFTTAGAEGKASRLRFSDHQIEALTSLKNISRVFNYMNTQINVAPDGSPIFTRDTGYQEIYALNVRWP